MDESLFPVQRGLASVHLDLTNWDSLVGVNKIRSIKRVPLQNVTRRGDDGLAVVPQLLLACFWSPESDDRGGGGHSKVDVKALLCGDDVSEASAVFLSGSALPRSLSLGSSLTLTINGICQIPSSVFKKMTTSCEAGEVVVRGRLLPSGGASGVVLPLQSAQVVADHCGNNSAACVCVRFTNGSSEDPPPVLSFELSPSVFDALQVGTDALRLEVEIRAKRSRDWSLSFCVGLASFIHGGSVQIQDWPSQLKLLDKADNFGGVICTAIGVRSAGSSSELSSLASQISPMTSSARVNVQIQDFRTSNPQTSSSPQVFAKLWSSSIGRQHAFKSPPLTWSVCEESRTSAKLPTRASSEAPAFEVEIATESAATEAFFIELCRFSDRERNEVLGSCSFSLPPDMLQSGRRSDANDGDNRIEKKWFRLTTFSQPKATKSRSSGSTSNSEICGEILVAMQIQDQSAHATPLVSSSASSLEMRAASSILSDVKYTPSAGGQPKNRGVLEIQVVDAYPPQSSLESVSSGDSLRVRLQLLSSSSQWSDQSTCQELGTPNACGDRRVSWNESFTSPSVSWSSKDRLVPALKLELLVRSKRTNLETIGKKPQLPLGSSPPSRPSRRSLQATRSNDKRNRIPTKSSGENDGSERCLGVYTLDLCALFTHPSAPAKCLLLLFPVDASGENGTEGDERAQNEHSGALQIPLLVNIRFVPVLQAPPSDLATGVIPKSLSSVQVNGDVCFHIKAASGNFLRRSGGVQADQYFVFAGFGSKSVSTRYGKSLLCNTVAHLSMEAMSGSIDDTNNDIICYRLASQAPDELTGITWNEHLVLPLNFPATPVIQLQVFKKRGTLNELVGSLSLPLFPSATQEQHLVAFTLPFASAATANGSSRYELRKEGSLEFEIQFFDRLQSQKFKALASQERVELVIHQLKGLRGENGLLSSLASSASLQVVKLSGRASSETVHGDQLTLYETTIQLIASSGQANGVIDLGDDHTVDLTAVVSGIQGHEGVVLALQVCDLERKPCGHVHFPLRKGWRERLFSRKPQRTWYQMHQVDQASTNRSTAQVQLSFAFSTSVAGCAGRLAGQLYVQVKEALVPRIHEDHSIKQMQPGTSAVVQISLSQDDASSDQMVKRGRTQKALVRDNESSWLWMNEAFVINQLVGNPLDRLHFELVCDSCGFSLAGSLEIERLGLETSEEWVTLSSNEASDGGGYKVLETQLLVQTKFAPAFTGVFEVRFGTTRPLSQSHSRIPIEKEYMRCTWERKSYTTPMAGCLGSEVDSGLSMQLQMLEIPFDSSRDSERGGDESSSRGDIPVLLVQWMGVASSIQEVCLGECSVDLHTFLSGSSPVVPANGDPTTSQPFKWYLLHDKHDKSTRTGFVSTSITFHPQRIRSGGTNTQLSRSTTSQPSRALTRSLRQVAKSESLAVWKKLFYLLDGNGNSRIDISEFKQLFLQHKDGKEDVFCVSIIGRLYVSSQYVCLLDSVALTSSSDGQNLLQSLFGNSSMGLTASRPSEAQLEELFADMDVNHDQVCVIT